MLIHYGVMVMFKDYSKLYGRGIQCRLDYTDQYAVLIIVISGYVIQVRGQLGVGTDYVGGPLDQVIDSFPKPGADVSQLHCGVTVGIGPKYTGPIIDTLKRLG